MLDAVKWDDVRLAVDLGAGMGNITRAMLTRLCPQATLLAIDINERFVTYIRETLRDSRLEVVHGSATDLKEIIAQRGFVEADAILSAIPFTSLSQGLRESILQSVQSTLAADAGRFVAIQYTPFVLPRLLTKYFGGYQVRRCWLNLPPALIYTCTRASSRGSV